MSSITERPTAPRLLPNLDGLRAFSVLLVLLFHSQFLGVKGGYIGVSVFFTISGYLLTHRLLSADLNRQAIVRYWGGRWRRILPAAWTVLVLITIYDLAENRAPLHPLRRLWANVFGMSNWYQLSLGKGYATLFQAADTSVHYWSLAIEQQVYLALPIVLLISSRVWKGRVQLPIIVALIMVSFLLPFLLGLSVSRAYYGTDTRMGEILVGVALAIAHRQRIVANRMKRRTGGALALVALGGLLTLAFTIGPGDDFIRHGMLPLVALLSTALVHAAVSVRGLLGGLFERRTSRFLGGLSYAIYLLHWPIIVALSDADLHPGFIFLGALGGSILIGMPLVRFIERPLRPATARRRWYVWCASTLAVLALLGSFVQPSRAQQFLSDLEHQAADILDTTSSAAPQSTDSTTPAPDDTVMVREAPTIGFFGDSIALTLTMLIGGHVPKDVLRVAGGSAVLGCGIVTQLEPAECAPVPANWSASISAQPVDLAIVVSCQWELLEREIPGVGRRAIGQPEMDALIRAAMESAIDRLLDGGATAVGWVLCPRNSSVLAIPSTRIVNDSRDPARVAALNAMARSVAADHPGRVALIDLDGWMTAGGYIDDPAIRPDGSHYTYEHATALSDAFPAILQPALDLVLTLKDP